MFVLAPPALREFSARSLRWMLTTHHMAAFSPPSWLSYAVDHAVWGLRPFGFHLTNVVLHAAAAVLLFMLARDLFARALPQAPERDRLLGAAAAALVFGLHPLRAESVAWISERRDVLAGPFFFGALLLYVRGRTGWALACHALAALTKPTAVPLPLLLLLLERWPLRRGPWTRSVATAAPFFAVSGAVAAAAVWAQVRAGNLAPLEGYGLAQRLAQAGHAGAFYLAKTVWPGKLSPLYPIAGFGAADAAVLAAAVGATAWAARRPAARPALAALWGAYLAMLLPVCGLIQNGPQGVASRYSYLACFGWALLAGAAFSRAGRAGRAALGAWLAALALWTGPETAVWRDEASLWTRAAALHPGFFPARYNLAVALAPVDPARALEEAAAAAALDPGHREAEALWRSLAGWNDAQAGRLDSAQAHLSRVAALQPRSAAARANLGALLARRERFAEALLEFDEAVRLEPAQPGYRAMAESARRDLARSRRR